jgi:hypothetical protein
MCEWLAAGTIYAFIACHLNLSWEYSGLSGWGFQIERCEGKGCSNFVAVGFADRFPIVPSYAFKDNQILLQNTLYCYRVKAGYGAGTYNEWTWGPYSNISCNTTLTIDNKQIPNKPQNIKGK